MMKTRLNELEVSAEELRRQTQFAKLYTQAGRFAGCAEDVVRRCELEAECGRDFCEVLFVPTAEAAEYGRLHVPAYLLPVVVDLVRLLMPGCEVTVQPQKNNQVPLEISWEEGK